MSQAPMIQIASPVADLQRVRRRRALRPRAVAGSALWYVVLVLLAVITVFPFFWMLMTSLKGPLDPVYSIPPQILPSDPSLAAYQRVLETLPIPTFFMNSLIVAVAVGCSTCWSPRWPPIRWRRCGSAAVRRSSTRCSRR